jgi:hypothetical protein
MNNSPDYEYLMSHARDRFPGSRIEIHYTDDEIIYIDIDGHRLVFEIGSDDDFYEFSDGATSFTIPLLEWD